MLVTQNPEMLKVENLNYDSWGTLSFQRVSVLVAESVLIYALSKYVPLFTWPILQYAYQAQIRGLGSCKFEETITRHRCLNHVKPRLSNHRPRK